MCEVHRESFDESWSSGDGFDDLPQPERHPHSTGSVAIREILVHFSIIECVILITRHALYTMCHLSLLMYR